MGNRLRTTITVRVANVDAFDKAVNRFLPGEHKALGIDLGFISVITDNSRRPFSVRVVVDSLAPATDLQDACQASANAAGHALAYLNEADLSYEENTVVVA